MSIHENINAVTHQINELCLKYGRDRDDVKVIAVSKLHPTSAIREAYAARQKAFGENYVAEYLRKHSELQELSLEWHFIGQLQSNKVNALIQAKAHCIHGVDRLSLAQKMQNAMEKLRPGEIQELLIEVKLAEQDAAKGGTTFDETGRLLSAVDAMPNLRCIGLMTIAPLGTDNDSARPYFRQCRMLMESLNIGRQTPLTSLSMGMSADFEAAVAEGATMIRIGTAIFGARG